MQRKPQLMGGGFRQICIPARQPHGHAKAIMFHFYTFISGNRAVHTAA
jgi:hypothetical protein